ncbi:thiosulfate/3-mercaptopyruvate sulfurtransferase [Paraoerskovia marina]|uniref:Thiosulfate/3-mercaptopyruvate sulfurtransferase n=1 Tax=Paraoerskovia marina TaxID=545619 RepID=A0A1H1V6R1_9CELL|nr:sulfurtransferase [Paraoerskovia marina]SDS80402.1 thiosulfate/3-mercaptopyruvate sulfurtransferase [Paraoerskovia marina]
MTREDVLVSPERLAWELGFGEHPHDSGAFDDVEPPVLLDVRWALGQDDGHERYLEGHLPGAVFVDMELELAGPASPAAGRHPLPAPEVFEQAARSWGVREGAPVVVYDATGGTAASRAWWLLRWAGHTAVRILDGGLPAWVRADLPTESGEVLAERGDVVVRPGGMPVLTASDAALLTRSGVLLDARAAERFRGEVEPIDPRAGHVPGARSAPTHENLDDAGSFLADERLRERFAAAGVLPGVDVGVYCGSGVTAAHQVAALAAVGIDAALYPGSWSQWSHDDARPVATGE